MSLTRHAVALEVTKAATVGRSTATATTTSTAATIAKSATTASAAAATATIVKAATTAATTATTAAEAATAGVVVTGSGKVQADVAAVDVGAVQALESSLGLVDRAELDVTEALGGAGLAVGGQTDAVDAAELGEVAGQGVGGGVEGNVADEQGGGRSALLLVTEGVGAGTDLVLVVAAVAVVSGGAEVALEGTAVEVGTVLGVEGLGGGIDVGELDV